MFYADLHVHSKYSRATSRDCDLENLAYWARKKGITVVGTGDFTHPAWRREIADKLVPAEPGLFRLRPEIQRAVDDRLGGACQGVTRFMLSVEISTIYKKGDKTRKVHHVVYAPDLDSVGKMVTRLENIGNLHSDGRPILGLDSRDLLEIVLSSGPDSYLVPAHVWTPWFAALGSKSGFDRIADCYGDLAGHIFAIETGLSSDPEMNWRVSHLDRYTLVSNSDAHSPRKLGREANLFTCELSYFAMREALETRRGFAGTVEFFPEEGKYHLDGHRKCGVVLEPEETRARDGLCPECAKPVTVGVMHRVQELADRPRGYRPDDAVPFRSLVPLPEVIAEIVGTGSGSKAVARNYEELLARVGDEFTILERAPVEELRRRGYPRIAEAVARMRAGEVRRQPGYDGEYGVIRVLPESARRRSSQQTLMLPGLCDPPRLAAKAESAAPARPDARGPNREPGDRAATAGPTASSLPEPSESSEISVEDADSPHLAALDPEQRRAAEILSGPLLIIAGPGTGKTRTLTHRIAHLIADHGAAPESCLAITFTNRAAGEMRERLVALVPDGGERVPVMTFHALALSILRDHRVACGLPRGFRIATDDERRHLLAAELGISERASRRLLAAISAAKRAETPVADGDPSAAMTVYRRQLELHSLVDFDDLLLLSVALLEESAEIRAAYRRRFAWISIDEYQDIDELQYRLVRLLCPESENLCAIGDPDQAIYRFRGADVGFFLRFGADFPRARTVELSRNYRSGQAIVEAAVQAIAPATLVAGRSLRAVSERPGRIESIATATERAEAETVVHTIEKLIGGTSFFSIDSGRVGGTERADLGFCDFAVLYRKESQSDALVEALARSGIPFQRRSHRRLAERAGVAALLRALDDDEAAAAPVQERLRRAADRLQAALAATADPAAATATESVPADSESSRAVLDHDAVEAAFEMLCPLAGRCGDDIGAFLSESACGLEVDTWDPRADRVSLLTLHAAKGLEFRVVFVVGCEDGLLPHRFGGELDEDSVAEERRLFFVAMTRARELLILTRAQKRLWHGRMRISEPCPFLADIDRALVAEREPGRRRRKRAAGSASQLGLF